MNQHEFSVTIVKKNRVWSELSIADRAKPIPVKTDSLPADCSVGDTLVLRGEVKYDTSKYGTKAEFVVMSDEDVKQAVVSKWLPLFDKNANAGHGYYYQRAVDEIHAVGVHEHDAHFAETQQLIEWTAIQSTYKTRGCVDENRVAKLRSLGCYAHDDEIAAMSKAAAEKKREERERRIAETLQREHDESICRLVLPAYNGFNGRPQKGTRLMYRGIPYEVVSSFYHDADGLSFGASADEWYEVKAINISNTDVGRQMLDDAASRQALAQAQAVKDNAMRDIGVLAFVRGTPITERMTLSDIPGTTIVDTFDIYGGGIMIKLDGNTVWYIVNNGADGDTWSINTIVTGGAGAYGYTIELDVVKDLIEKIKNL